MALLCFRFHPTLSQHKLVSSPYRYFVDQVDAISIADGKIPVRWEEVWTHFGTQLDKRTIIHAWKTTECVIK